MIDKDNTYPMEKIAASGIEKFIDYYNKIQFECKNMEFAGHESYISDFPNAPHALSFHMIPMDSDKYSQQYL